MNVTQYESFSSLLAAFFEKKGRVERMTRRSSDLHKAVVNARDRLARKLSAQKKELASAHDREKYKRTGELITANLYQLEKGMNKAKVIDYYNKDCPEVEISLDGSADASAERAEIFQTLYQVQNCGRGIDRTDQTGKYRA